MDQISDINQYPDDTPLKEVSGYLLVRAWNGLVNHADPPYKTVGDVRRATEGDLHRIPNVGWTTVRELKSLFPRTPSLLATLQNCDDCFYWLDGDPGDCRRYPPIASCKTRRVDWCGEWKSASRAKDTGPSPGRITQ